MGFEIIYKYHERNEDGSYNKDVEKELKRKLGDPFDETSLDSLAGSIMAQLARRDIWVTDVQIFEFKKKEITFKETKGGIVIKNKKFTLDQTASVIAEDIIEVQKIQDIDDDIPQLPVSRNLPPNDQVNRVVNKKVRTWMIFDPEPQMLSEIKNKGLKFTMNKKYPVYSIEEHPMGLQFGNVLKTVDDANREQLISDKFFIPASVNLIKTQEDLQNPQQQQEFRPNLMYENAYNGENDAFSRMDSIRTTRKSFNPDQYADLAQIAQVSESKVGMAPRPAGPQMPVLRKT